MSFGISALELTTAEYEHSVAGNLSLLCLCIVASMVPDTNLLKNQCEINKIELTWKEGLFSSVIKFLMCKY